MVKEPQNKLAIILFKIELKWKVLMFNNEIEPLFLYQDFSIKIYFLKRIYEFLFYFYVLFRMKRNLCIICEKFKINSKRKVKFGLGQMR